MIRVGIGAWLFVVAGSAGLRRLGRARWRRAPRTRPPSRVPWWFARRAVEAEVPVERAWSAWRTLAVTVAAAAVVVPVTLAALIAVALAVAPFAAVGPLRRRAEHRLDTALPGALEAVARSLRSGASLRMALADAAEATPGRLGDDLGRVVHAASVGIPLSEALDDWGRRCPRPGVLLAVAALGLAIETGGASARAVEGVAATLRRRLDTAEEALALSAQARASAGLLAGAPLAVCAFTVVGGGPAARFLLGTPLGFACLALGLSLDGLGGWWMARLTRPAVARRSGR